MFVGAKAQSRTMQTHREAIDASNRLKSEVLAADGVAAAKRALLASLLVEIANGDEHALRAVYDATCKKLFGVCLRICGDHTRAAEALQDVYLIVWRRAKTFDPERGSAITWLVTIARNKAVDTARRWQAPVYVASWQVNEVRDDRPNAEQTMLAKDEMATVTVALAGLDVADAVLLKAIYEEGLTYPTLAARTGKPIGTVKSRVRRAILAMRANLQLTPEI